MMQRRDSGAQFRAHSHDPGIKSPLLWSNVMTDLWWVQSLSLGFTISRISFAQDAVSIKVFEKSQVSVFPLSTRKEKSWWDIWWITIAAYSWQSVSPYLFAGRAVVSHRPYLPDLQFYIGICYSGSIIETENETVSMFWMLLFQI